MTTAPASDTNALSHRRTATLVGVLYITGTAAGICSRVIGGAGPSGPDYLANAASTGNDLVIGALFILLMGLSLAFIPVLLFPILRATSRRLALGYLVFRGALETTVTIVIVTSWLVLHQMGRDYDPANVDAAGMRSSGAMLAEAQRIIGTIPGPIVFLTGVAMFYWVLFRARLVPRWLSVWGLVAILPYLAYALMAAFGTESSSAETILDAPMALQEMVLAVWLLVRGFREPGQATPIPARLVKATAAA